MFLDCANICVTMPRWETVGDVQYRGHDSLEWRFVWRVHEKYFLPPYVGSYVGSPTFRYANNILYLTKWPNGWFGSSKYQWIALSVCGTNSQCPVLNVRLGIRKTDGEDLKISRGNTTPYGCFEDTRYLRSSQILERINEVSNNGYITVFCDVRMADGSEMAAGAIPLPYPRGEENMEIIDEARGYYNEYDELPLSEEEGEIITAEPEEKAKSLTSKSFDKLLQDFKGLWVSEEDCDISFKVHGDELSAHKIILQARCPVFHSMFKHKMSEQTSGVVEIDDCDPNSFRDFLHYIYTGSVENISAENVFSLFAVAHKYCLEELRNECSEFIKTSLCVDTFCDSVTLSLRFSEADLLEQATKFYSKNMKKIIVTQEWETFLRENTAEGNKLLIKALIPENERFSED